jgi:hypothetical protein
MVTNESGGGNSGPSNPNGNFTLVPITNSSKTNENSLKFYQISKATEVLFKNFNDALPSQTYAKFKNEM